MERAPRRRMSAGWSAEVNGMKAVRSATAPAGAGQARDSQATVQSRALPITPRGLFEQPRCTAQDQGGEIGTELNAERASALSTGARSAACGYDPAMVAHAAMAPLKLV